MNIAFIGDCSCCARLSSAGLRMLRTVRFWSCIIGLLQVDVGSKLGSHASIQIFIKNMDSRVMTVCPVDGVQEV